MTATAACDNPAPALSLRQAVRAQRWGEAEELLSRLPADPPAELLPLVAEVHLNRLRFVEAAALYDRVEKPDIHVRLSRNVARNFASLEKHRPADLNRLVKAKLGDRYRLVPVTGNRLTIADCKDPARPVLMTPGGDPVKAVHDTINKLADRMRNGDAIALAGIGDGFVLGTLARITPKLFMDMQQCLHLLEPDLSLVLCCFRLHDFSGPNGPIEQPRFQWFIGDDWAVRYREALHGDVMLPQPTATVQQSREREAILPVVQSVSESLKVREEKLKAENAARYASWRRERLTSTLDGGRSGKPPRVLLLTSRFTTVLQYATRGVAGGLESLGFETQTLIEPSPYRQISRLTMRQAVATFQPDLVFQIDHLRHEHEDTFPPQLPFACWIQDHLGTLTDAKAGRAVGPRDFVLTFASPLFIDTYQYPARQCIDMPMMLTWPRDALPQRTADAPDLVYVSNVSHDPAKLETGMLNRATTAAMREVIAEASRRMTALYERGGSMPSRHELRELIGEVTASQGIAALSAEDARLAVEILWNPLNITLYRQQALGWVADAASELGLSLGIYGRGWETHPRFAPFARGVIEYGEPLARLTRSAKINLNLEPYTCFTHQRLLDGLVAGGFFLIRRHPGDSLLQELLNFLEDHCDASVQSVEQARRATPAALRERLDDLLRRSLCLTFEESADPVRQARCWQRAGVLVRQDAALPHLGEVTFEDASACRTLLKRFIDEAPRRETISAEQRQSIEHRMSFTAGMRLVTQRIAELLRVDGATSQNKPEAA